jgi:O-succinylbenzoate synthase
MAAVDGAARRRGVSLFEDLKIPPSHYSWDQNQPVESQMRRVVDEGWRAIKMKGSVKFEDNLAAMDALVQWIDKERDLPSPGRKDTGTWQVPTLDAPWLRMDFNSCLTEQAFVAFLDFLPSHWRPQVDFIEDPFPYDVSRWSAMQRDHGIRLALDKQLRGAAGGFDVAVMKPGRRDWRDILPNLPGEVKIVMTSAMDHAIGQCFAAYEAALAWKECGGRMDLCGLCTEHLFEKDEFFERIRSHSGILEIDRSGTGLGFDEMLAKLEWKKL